MALQCELVTPEQQVLDEPITQAIVPAHDGLVGIRTGRAPLLVKLGLGPLRLDLVNGQQRFFYIDGGVAQVKNNRITILTDQAEASGEIDMEAARAEYAEASARRITDDQSFEQRQRALQRSRTKQEMARTTRG
jgi:F-type H+-transporting ATPase subunit epsilon